MMTAAITLLKQNIEDQRGKLDAIRKEHEATIRAGQAAQREVDAQFRHVNELAEALATVEAAERAQQGKAVG